MQVEQLLKKTNSELFAEWVKELATDREFAELLDEAERSTREKLRLR